MSLRINSNIDALTAHRHLEANSAASSKSMARLSSGYRINSASDDAAGLSISERMRGQIRGLGQAKINAQDGISMVQTAESALNNVHSMLQRARELAVQFQNGSLSTADRTAIQAEVDLLHDEIQRIADQTAFNGTNVLNSNSAVSFQIGANDGEVIAVSSITLLGTPGTVDPAVFTLTPPPGPSTDLADLDGAINAISSARSEFGAVQNRLEYTVSSISTYHENLVSAESRIRDVDMAAEIVNSTKLQILQQAGTAMLAQANQSNQGVLSLLQG